MTRNRQLGNVISQRRVICTLCKWEMIGHPSTVSMKIKLHMKVSHNQTDVPLEKFKLNNAQDIHSNNYIQETK